MEPSEGLIYTIELFLARSFGSNVPYYHYGVNPYLKIYKIHQEKENDIIKVTKLVNNTINPTFHDVIEEEFDFRNPQKYRVEVHHAEEYKTLDVDHVSKSTFLAAIEF